MVETLRKQKDELITSEYAKKRTEVSPNSRLGNINKMLGNPILQNIRKIKNLKNKIKNREYRSFQRLIGVPYHRCDGKLGRESLDYFNNYINKLAQEQNGIYRTNNSLGKLRDNISGEQRGITLNNGNISGDNENKTDTLNIQRNEAQYLAKHETMSQSEYNRLFSGKEKLQQGQLGDCYLVSGINVLARAQHFDTLMRTSIQRVNWNDGSGSGYQIKIPLGEPSGRKILLKDSELSVAKIRGNTGYKLLELAYAKNKLRKNDRKGNQYSPITEAEFNKISGGFTVEVLQSFLGKNNIGCSDFGTRKNEIQGKFLNQCSTQKKQEIENFLKNFDPTIGNKFASVAGPSGSDRKGYVVGGKTIYYSHEYAITGVSKDQNGKVKTITVLNPRNTQTKKGGNYQEFTLDEFFKGFSGIYCGKINNTKTFLDNV